MTDLSEAKAVATAPVDVASIAESISIAAGRAKESADRATALIGGLRAYYASTHPGDDSDENLLQLIEAVCDDVTDISELNCIQRYAETLRASSPTSIAADTASTDSIEKARDRVQDHDDVVVVAEEFVDRIRDRTSHEKDIQACVAEITEILSGSRGAELREAAMETLRAEMRKGDAATRGVVSSKQQPQGGDDDEGSYYTLPAAAFEGATADLQGFASITRRLAEAGNDMGELDVIANALDRIWSELSAESCIVRPVSEGGAQ